MGVTPSDFEPQAEMVMERVERGLDMLEEYGAPLLERYGRRALVVGVAVVAVAGVALLVARRTRRRTLRDRIQGAVPEVRSRLERPISTIRSAADRLSR
jgi:hypothetical protein